MEDNKTFKIQYLSDLHFEFKYNKSVFKRDAFRKPYGNVLVIAGDLDYLSSKGEYTRPYTKDYLSWASDHYEKVFIVPGNHEYWGGELFGTFDMSNAFHPYKLDIFPNVSLCSNVIETYKGYKFAFTTLWYSINNPLCICSYGKSNEFAHLRLDGKPLTLDKLKLLYTKCVNFIKESNADIIVTHHAPTYRVMPKAFECDKMNDMFYNNLDNLIVDLNPKLWIFGHTHFADLKGAEIFKPVKLVSNAIGYLEIEDTGFDITANIELPELNTTSDV